MRCCSSGYYDVGRSCKDPVGSNGDTGDGGGRGCAEVVVKDKKIFCIEYYLEYSSNEVYE